MHISIQEKHKIQLLEFSARHAEIQASTTVYLVPLVRFGHPALWNHLHSIHFVVGEVRHLVASSKATLREDKQNDQLTKAAG